MEKVNLYGTARSGDTERIRDFLTGKGIEFRAYDIHEDVTAHKHMLEATRGACGAPVTEFPHTIVCGFDAERLEDSIAKELR